jgi:hypothetical protein
MLGNYEGRSGTPKQPPRCGSAILAVEIVPILDSAIVEIDPLTLAQPGQVHATASAVVGFSGKKAEYRPFRVHTHRRESESSRRQH